MKKVTMYQANDGTTYAKAADAEARNNELRLAPLVEKFVNGLAENSTGVSITSDDHYVVLLQNLPTFLTAHADALRVIFSPEKAKARKPRADQGKPRGPRKTKAETAAVVANAAQ